MNSNKSRLRSIVSIAVLTHQKHGTMNCANRSKRLVYKVQFIRHLRDLVTPESDMLIPKESNSCSCDKVVV